MFGFLDWKEYDTVPYTILWKFLQYYKFFKEN